MSKNLLRALGLESIEVDQPVTEPSFNEPAAIIEEGNTINTVTGDTMRTVATLETLNTILAGAPEDQINETTAEIIDASMQDIVGRYEMVKESRLAVESFRSAGKESYLRFAREDVSGKLAGFKKGLETIIEKIIELIQKFWQWLTMNHKRVKASLAEAAKAVASADGKQTIPFQVKFRTLLNGETLDADSINETANCIFDLCETSQVFITKSFDTMYHSLGGLSETENIIKKLNECFGDYATSVEGEYLLYSNIGGRKFAMAMNPNRIQHTDQVFDTSLSSVTDSSESPDSITLTKQGVDSIIKSAIAAVDASEKDFFHINKIQKNLKDTKFSSKQMQIPANVLQAYNKCIVQFIDGAFTQALRHGNAVAALAQAYAKQGNNVVAEA